MVNEENWLQKLNMVWYGETPVQAERTASTYSSNKTRRQCQGWMLVRDCTRTYFLWKKKTFRGRQLVMTRQLYANFLVANVLTYTKNCKKGNALFETVCNRMLETTLYIFLTHLFLKLSVLRTGTLERTCATALLTNRYAQL
jgi:hypothetical protein